MPHYQRKGKLPQKRFVTWPRPGGGVHYEHLFTAQGFAAEDSILYRLAPPTRVIRTEFLEPMPAVVADGPATNALFHVDRVPTGGDFVSARRPMVTSDAVVFSIAHPDCAMEGFYRNGWCDELVLVVEGSGTFSSCFGEIPYGPLDIFHIPRGDTVQWRMDTAPQTLAIVESRTSFGPPPWFLKPNGQLRQNAPFKERDMRTPDLREPLDLDGNFPILVRTGNDMTRITVDRHPFDVVGWDGHLYPYCVSMRDIEPMTGRIHLMPDQYACFVSAETMVTLLTPRRMADHPESTPSQPFHQSLDFDEILYRLEGGTGITEPKGGTFTIHPRGFDHGPKPGAENAPRRERQDVWGLMIDSRSHMKPTREALECRDAGYDATWTSDQLGPG